MAQVGSNIFVCLNRLSASPRELLPTAHFRNLYTPKKLGVIMLSPITHSDPQSSTYTRGINMTSQTVFTKFVDL